MGSNYKSFKEWPERLKMRLKELSMTQETLASELEVTRGAIAHYLSGRRVPPIRQFQKLAEILKTDPVWLQYGVEPNSEGAKKYFPEIDPMNPITPIPIFSWKQIAEIPDLEDIDKIKKVEYVPHFFTDELGQYALRIKGDSMTSASGHMVSFREGEIIIVDIAKKPRHNDHVVVVLPGSNEATLRQYIDEGGIRYLKPLNPQYPLMEMDDKTRFCGIVVYRIGG